MVIIPGMGGIMATMFTDTVTTKRAVDSVDTTTGIVTQGYTDTILDSVACYMSVKNRDTSTDTNEVGITKNDVIVIFLPAGTDVLKGDWVTITKASASATHPVFEGRLGVPQFYPSHTQVSLTEVGMA